MNTLKEKKKTSKGKQKIPLQKIEKRGKLYVSFSKRKHGLFSSASDLCSMCGTEVAVLLFSPVGQPFSFGCPNADRVLDRFQFSNMTSNAGLYAHEAYRSAIGDSLNQRAMELRNLIDAEKARKAVLHRQLTAATQGLEWLNDLNNLDLAMLDELQEALVQIKNRAINRVMQLQTGLGASSSNAGASGSGGIATMDSRGQGVQPMLNPALPFKELSTDLRASSSNAVIVGDHVATSEIAPVDSRGKGIQPMLNPVLAIEEFSIDPRASSSSLNAITIDDHVGISGSSGIGIVDSRWQDFQPMLNLGLSVDEFSIDPRVSSSNVVTIVDHAGTFGSRRISPVDSRGKEVRHMPNPVLPVKEFSTDRRASSSNVVTSNSSGNMTSDSRWQGVQPMLNPLLPFKEFLIDPRASSSNAVIIGDHMGTFGLGGIATVDSRWQGVQPMLNPSPPFEEFSIDPRASSSNAVIISDHVGTFDSPIASRWQAVLPIEETDPTMSLSNRVRLTDNASTHGSNEKVTVDSEWQGFQNLNPSVKEFSTDPRASSSNEVTGFDLTSTSDLRI